jgi:uncharacterized membrane protein YfcA
VLAAALALYPAWALAGEPAAAASLAWLAGLFAICVALGVVAVPAGVGGGVLFVPIVGSLFPFHLDFVRGAGLMVALASALSASPALLRAGYASTRLALPLAVLVSASQLAGARAGLALPANMLEIALGVLILAISVLMIVAGSPAAPGASSRDPIAQALRLHGVLRDPASGVEQRWTVHRSGAGIAAFLAIGLLAGLFGLGAGWANVPALHLLMGVPLKVAVGTSSLILATTSTAAWVYVGEGAILPFVVVPSVVGMMLGARLGARLLHHVPAAAIRRLVIAMLAVAGARVLAKGLGLWT